MSMRLGVKFIKSRFKKLRAAKNATVYGGQRFRSPIRSGEFVGTKGSLREAVILDIDGTLQGWGDGVQRSALEFCARHDKLDRTFIIITARDHEHSYWSSFNWLMVHFPYPFIGPFCRSLDDPRYTSEFKRELAQGFEDMGLYRIVGAADDNSYCQKMWKQWAIEHFEVPGEFDLLECCYESYPDWRSGLSPKHRPAGQRWSSIVEDKMPSDAWIGYGDFPEDIDEDVELFEDSFDFDKLGGEFE